MAIESWWQDLRFGLRTLGKSPGFAAVAITILALGIGANATVFSLANAILFKNLPFRDSERVLYLTSVNARNPGDSMNMSVPDYMDSRNQLKSFENLGASTHSSGDLSDDQNAPESYRMSRITANGFAAIGQRPALGRGLQPQDERAGAEPVIILGWALWIKRYGGTADIIGKKIRVDSVPTTVIGVMAEDLTFPGEAEFWLPLSISGTEKRQDRFLTVFGKLAKGATLDSAQAEVSTLSRRLAAQYPDTNKDARILVQNFNQFSLGGRVRAVFLVLLGAVGFVLLIACANVANLMLARAAGRAREISIRTAVGAGRWRVVRQLLIESLLLSIAGGLAGWGIAEWGVRAFDAAVIPTGKPAWIDFSMDYRAFGFLAAITFGTSILFGLAPALKLARLDVNAALKDGGRGAGTGIRGKRISGVLVIAEMALAVVLLAGAGLMIRSFLHAYTMPTGADTANVLTMRLELPRGKYPNPEQQVAFRTSLLPRLRSLPGVETVAIANQMPSTGGIRGTYEREDSPEDGQKRLATRLVLTGDGYFEILRVSARRGRVFSESDQQGEPGTIVVNQTFANTAWPGGDPVGKRVRLTVGGQAMQWSTVVGVVPDILRDVQEPEAQPMVYLPLCRKPLSWMFVFARTGVDPATLGTAFRREVQAIDRDLPVREVRALDDFLAMRRWPWRIFGGLFTIFAGVALLLATVGLYAVVAYGVEQRTQEIGVRAALGASGMRILKVILAQGIRQTAIGLVLGLGAAIGITRVMGSFLLGISASDPITFAVAALVLIGAAIAGLPGHAGGSGRSVAERVTNRQRNATHGPSAPFSRRHPSLWP
jgi:putative ABC transport system permease protein